MIGTVKLFDYTVLIFSKWDMCQWSYFGYQRIDIGHVYNSAERLVTSCLNTQAQKSVEA